MSMLEYVTSLLPSFGQDKIVDDLARQRKELDEILLPSLEQAEKAFKGQKFKSTFAKGLETTLKSRFRDHRSEDLFGILHDIFKSTPAKVEALEKLVESFFAKDVTKEAITYRKAAILKFIETLSFAIQYTSRITLRVITAEAEAESGSQEEVHIHGASKSFLEDKYITWLDTLVLIDQPVRRIEEQLTSIPEVVVNEDSAAHIEAVEGKRLDPMRLNFVSPSINPLYHFGNWLAEHQVSSANRAKEERKLVELRLHDLKNRREGKPDANIQHKIELFEDRIKKLDFQIAKNSAV